MAQIISAAYFFQTLSMLTQQEGLVVLVSLHAKKPFPGKEDNTFHMNIEFEKDCSPESIAKYLTFGIQNFSHYLKQ